MRAIYAGNSPPLLDRPSLFRPPSYNGPHEASRQTGPGSPEQRQSSNVSKWLGLAGALLLPYAAWVAFASMLNGAIWRMN
jgi:hypothetical protein